MPIAKSSGHSRRLPPLLGAMSMGVDSGQPSRVVTAYLDDIEAELAAFDALVAIGSRFAAFHLEQAAEKLIRAVRIHRKLVVTSTHDIVLLVDGHPGDPLKEPRPLPAGDPWRARMREHEWLSKFATAFRYPTSAGRRDQGPIDDELKKAKQKLVEHLTLARKELIDK
ncbi:MAG: HEPN domain-containing protein [Deltaproteobacteria bacterium]|nr:MAG: HEPN domain-containing protein [Deltaproteobacteria bacterium]